MPSLAVLTGPVTHRFQLGLVRKTIWRSKVRMPLPKWPTGRRSPSALDDTCTPSGSLEPSHHASKEAGESTSQPCAFAMARGRQR